MILTRAEELIDPHSGQWDEDLIRSVFSAVDVHRILRIPLRVEVVEDFIAWHYNRSGTFSVRSAYDVEFEHQFRHLWNRTNAQGSEVHDSWKNVWALCILGKLKHFVWKVLRGVLPCFGTLAGRHIPVLGQCPICHIGYEDIQHCIFTYSQALEVWAELGLKEEILKTVVEDRSGSVTTDTLIRRQNFISELPMACSW